MNIGFLGAGNMGGAILRGYAKTDVAKKNQLYVFGVNHEKLKSTCKETGAVACYEIEELVKKSDIFLIGVKPDKFDEVMPKIAKVYTKDKICVSMAAGISMEFIESYLGDEAAIVRIMPNTPAQVGFAMTSVSLNKNIKKENIDTLLNIFGSIGKAEIVDEKLIHTVIGVSGSSPAYTYMYIDALAKSAASRGMMYEQAKTFAAQAVLGAAKMVLESEETPEKLRINVCSPGGTTIQAVNKLQELKFDDIIDEAFCATMNKSKEMER